MMKMVMGKIEFMKSEGDNDRSLAVYVTLKHDGISASELSDEYDRMIDHMEANLDDCEFCRCPDENEEEHTYCDGFYVDFEYGTMSKLKKEISKEWQACKKALGYC